MGFIKWIGLFSGFAQTQSVLGAIAGFVIGSVIDSIWSSDSKPTAAQSSTETANTSAEDSRSRFLFSLMVLASHVIQADGKIMHSEMETVRKFLRNTFGETSVEEGNNILLRLFEYRKNRGEAEWQMEIRKVCDEIAGFMPVEHRLQLIDFLIVIAKADGTVHPAEIEAVKQVAVNLGVIEQMVNQMLSLGGDSLDDAYRVLGISPSATNEEVRAAYRNMVKLNHPDRVATLGDDVKEAATRKLQEINRAKEMIYQTRDM